MYFRGNRSNFIKSITGQNTPECAFTRWVEYITGRKYVILVIFIKALAELGVISHLFFI